MNGPSDTGGIRGPLARPSVDGGPIGASPEAGIDAASHSTSPSVDAAQAGAAVLNGLFARLKEQQHEQSQGRAREGDCFVETEHSMTASRLLADAQAFVSRPAAQQKDWTAEDLQTLRTTLDEAEIASARHELVTNETRIERKRGKSDWNRLSIKFMDGSIDYLKDVEFFQKPPALLERAVNAVYSAIRRFLAPLRGLPTESAEPIRLADIFRRIGLVFDQHGQKAEAYIQEARNKHDAGPMTPERAREVCELAAKARKSADAYDKLRTVLLECGVANVMTPLITIALEFVYRWMERNGHERWDQAHNVVASLKEFIPYEGVNLFGYRFPIMGRDMSILNRATRGTLFSELRGSLVESGGNLALSWFFRKKTGVGLEWARLAVAPLIGAAASAESYRKVNPEVKGHLPTSFFAALGAVNGTIRFVPAQFFIKWFFPKVEKQIAPKAPTPVDPPLFAFPAWNLGKAA